MPSARRSYTKALNCQGCGGWESKTNELKVGKSGITKSQNDYVANKQNNNILLCYYLWRINSRMSILPIMLLVARLINRVCAV